MRLVKIEEADVYAPPIRNVRASGNKRRTATISLVSETLLIRCPPLNEQLESRRTSMLTVSRRGLLASAAFTATAFTATFGHKGLVFPNPAHAETSLEPTTGFYKYKVGSIEVTAVYDGIWRKPKDRTFIKNASVEDTKEALAKAGLSTEFMPIPLTVVVLKIGDKYVMIDSGSGVGQWQANATNLPSNMKAAGIDRGQISTILVSQTTSGA